MLKIYGQTRSRTFRVLWLCKESNIAFQQEPISIHVPNAQAKEEWYTKLNPNARIPTIDDDGFVMWESGAINLYLAKKYKSPLWPATAQDEGNALQWAFYIANDVEPPMITVFQNRFVFPRSGATRRWRKLPTRFCARSSRCSTTISCVTAISAASAGTWRISWWRA